jgi:Flp pilus assembly protein TadG
VAEHDSPQLKFGPMRGFEMFKVEFPGIVTRGGKLLQRFRREASGAAAIEFAFIAPLLITMFLGTMEISQGVEINKKVARSAGVIGDLVGQNNALTMDELEDLMEVGKAILQPYNRSAMSVTISLIEIDNNADPKISWSYGWDGENFVMPSAAGSATTVPANLKIAETYLIRVNTALEYLPITSWSIQKNKGTGPSAYASIDMSETYHLRPRVADTVLCSDCDDFVPAP